MIIWPPKISKMGERNVCTSLCLSNYCYGFAGPRGSPGVPGIAGMYMFLGAPIEMVLKGKSWGKEHLGGSVG